MAINPLQPPIQYGMEPQDPAAAMLEGLRIGEVFRQRRQMREQQQLAEQYKADASAYYANPTPQGALELARKYPDQGAAFMQEYRALDQEKQNNLFDRVARVVSAMAAGRNDVALQQADQEILAAKESGRDTSSLENIKFALETDPDNAYGPVLQILSVMNPPRAEKLMESLTKSAQATVEAGTSEARITEATASARIAKINSNFQRRLNESLLAQRAATIEASGASAEEARATAEAQRTATEQENRGILPVGERPAAENTLRNEYLTQTKTYRDIKAAYDRVLAAQPTPVGDIALVFSYMKMLDPGSVVREGEFATASNAGGIPTRIINLYNKAVSGDILTEEQRAKMRSQALEIFKKSETDQKEIKDGVARIANSRGLNVDNIFYDFTAPQAAGSDGPVDPNNPLLQ